MILRNSRYIGFLTKLAQESDKTEEAVPTLTYYAPSLRSPGLHEGLAASRRALGVGGNIKSLMARLGVFGGGMGAGAGLGALVAKAISKDPRIGAAVGGIGAAIPGAILGSRLSQALEKKDLARKGIFRVPSGSPRFPIHAFTPDAYEKYVRTEKRASAWDTTLQKLAFSAGLGQLGGRAVKGALSGGGAIAKTLWKRPKAAFGALALGMPIAGGVEGFQKARMLRGQQRLASRFQIPYGQQHFR